ncbi:dimethylaniline monooxygenase [Microdochium trichocladiopsis]|uniref:Dimethylaniline monooxygenase n=1 Tax=Microdochium trichocladiopsis TaxID=1682393 RepID=A0A9P8YBW0_9PEZI|nr:dimethylaniline monooxygenase [Microdochium trichocladiopsis]KAH7037876.1 dimethylaniline monooxygenase [Microdochium trichocladiopsis]
MVLIRVAVIGGGPGGLVALKTLLDNSTPEQPIEACLFEAEDDIGGTFKYRAYENAELVSSKQLTSFSDFRFPPGTPDHVTLPQYVEYLRSYADHFKLWPHIRLGCRVAAIEPCADSASKWKHQVVYKDKDMPEAPAVYRCSHIAICTGLHVEPNVPTIPGSEHVKGDIFHSASYKGRAQLAHRDVLILGCGETAMDIAYEAIKADAKSVTMCFRTGFLSFPKQLSRFQVFGKAFKGGLPIDGLITNLFETAYVHSAIANSRLRWFVSDFVIKRVLWFLAGSTAGMNQHVGGLPNDRLGRAYVFLNKSNKAMPYLNRPWKQSNWLLDLVGNKYIDPPEDAQSDRWVDTCTFPTGFDGSGRAMFEERPDRKDWVRMKDKVVRPDCVVLCTGYKQTFSLLHPSYPTASSATVRNIINPSHPDIAFIGFVRPGVGAIPPIAEQQSLWYTALITNRMPLSVPMSSPPHYHLLAKSTARIQYGVDHSAYMSQLGRDFGGAPGIPALLRAHGLHVTLIYCFGASFCTFYRLLGPFAFPGAVDITKGELAETIYRRGLLGNLFFGLIPMVFYGLLNALAWVLEKVGTRRR